MKNGFKQLLVLKVRTCSSFSKIKVSLLILEMLGLPKLKTGTLFGNNLQVTVAKIYIIMKGKW